MSQSRVPSIDRALGRPPRGASASIDLDLGSSAGALAPISVQPCCIERAPMTKPLRAARCCEAPCALQINVRSCRPGAHSPPGRASRPSHWSLYTVDANVRADVTTAQPWKSSMAPLSGRQRCLTGAVTLRQDTTAHEEPRGLSRRSALLPLSRDGRAQRSPRPPL
jgi:hypothetical protein